MDKSEKAKIERDEERLNRANAAKKDIEDYNMKLEKILREGMDDK